MSGLGERGARLRAVARRLEPPPAVPPFYVQTPDEEEIRALGWYMRESRGGPPIFLGHSAAAAELWLHQLVEKQRGKAKKGRGRKRAAA